MLRSVLMGIIAGARSITPLAAVSNAAAHGALPENDWPVRLLGHPLVVAGTTALAAAEMGGDKMKSAPDRVVLPGMLARVASAGIAGAALAPRKQRLAAAAAAVAASLVSAHLTWRARMKAMERHGQTSTGTVEDALIAAGAAAIVRWEQRGDDARASLRYAARTMTDYKSDLLRLLSGRGYIHQVTDAEGLDALAAKQIVPAYIGFDPTAPSLHVGSLVQIMLLRRLQQTGHKPIVLMGGGTGKVGDPSFKDEARKLMTEDTIAANIASIKTVFENFLTFGDGPTDAIMLDNAQWLDALEYLPFLRDYGQHFSVNRMLSFDSVKLRLDREQSLSFLEFNYMILQAYDFLELSRRHACRLQLGGSDQWGNIVNGIELSRRCDGTEVYGVTTPLITTADGGKMGKTMSGAVWLNAEQLSHYDYWQFWRNTDDRDVGRFLRLFTDLPLDEIARLEALEGAEINQAKIILANEATAMCRGASAAAEAAETARKLFEEGAAGGALPTLAVPAEGMSVVQANVAIGFAASNKEVKRKIEEGAIRVNDEKVTSTDVIVRPGDKISFGAKKHGLLIHA